MKTKAFIVIITILFSISYVILASETGGGTYDDPQRFEKSILKFEASDKQQAPPQEAILCIGSSSMRYWHDMIHQDLDPLTLIPRGFGGSTMHDVLYFADRVVLPYRPRAIVLYEGDNDIAQGVSPEKIKETFLQLLTKVHKALPECRIYVLAIKPSISRLHLWPTMQKANRLIAEMCQKDKRLHFVDIATPMLDDQGTPKPDLFQEDKLHMNRKGYLIWRDTLKPILLKNEQCFESTEKKD